MRHSQLRSFHYVALLGGFSRAAEALFLTQPAISEQVRKLEQDHDVLLFHRERKRVRLTSAGEQLFRLTRQYFEVEEQIEEYLSEMGTAIEGELRILADSAYHVNAVISEFRKRYPNVAVSILTGNTEQILDDLRAYNAEIGVVGNLTPTKQFEALSLGETPIVAYAAQGVLPKTIESLTLREVVEFPIILREVGSETRQRIEDEALRQKIPLKPVIIAEGRETVREVVASGAGVGFVSQAEFGYDTRLVAYPLKDADLRMNESIVHLTQRRDVRTIRAFMEFARKVYGAD